MINGLWLVLLAIAVLQLAGCASAPTIDIEELQLGSVREAFAEQHEKQAREHESSGSLRLALQEWSAISAVFPEASEPRAQIERLQRLITLKVAKYQRTAATALTKADYAGARLYYLKTLALQPDNRDAIASLKKLEVKSGYSRLAKAPKLSGKVVQAYELPGESSDGKAVGAIAEPVKSSSPAGAAQAKFHATVASPSAKGNLKLALRYLSEKKHEAALAHFLLARKHKEASTQVLNKHIAYTRGVLAEQHYDIGVSAFRAASYDLAVVEFKKALEYNPQHQKARLYLGSATEMQTRLTP